MSYDEIDPRLTAYVLNEADAEERAALEEAIASDPALKSIVDELSNASRALADTVKAGGLENDELHFAQRTQIETCAAEVKHPRRLTLRRRLAYVGIAAAVLILAGTLTLKGELERNIAAWFPTPAQMLPKGEPKAIAKNDTQQPIPEPVANAELKTILAGENASGAKDAPQSSELGDLAEFSVAPNGSSASGRDGSARSSSPPMSTETQSDVDAQGNRAQDLVAQGQFFLENKKFDRAKESFDRSLQIEPENKEAKRLLSEATVGAYNDEIDKAWEKRGTDRGKIRGGLERDNKLPEGADSLGIKMPSQSAPAGESNAPKLAKEKIEELKSLGYVEESREQIAKRVSPGGLADLDEYQVNTQGNNGTPQRGSSMSAANGDFDLTLQPNESANGAFNGPGITSSFNWQDTDTHESENGSVLSQAIVPVDVNGDGIVENIPIYTKFDATKNLEDIIAQYRAEIRTQGELLESRRERTTESYAPIVENLFTQVSQEPLSTFGLDVDTASYANTRRFLNSGKLPPPNAVRIEEFVNAFKYEYAAPSDDRPVALRGEIAGCPWNPEHRLARIAVKAKDIPFESQPPLRLTFLIDVSGSMEDNNKLPLLRESMKALTRKMSRTDSQIAIVTYRDKAELVLGPTPCGADLTILSTINSLRAEGSTNGAGGIELAYETAKKQFLEGGLNRVILATDGDFNVGETENAALVQRITEHAKSGVYLTVLGFGVDNLQDDRLEGLADKGNGNYFYIDSFAEANKVLVDRMAGTIAVAAKDVKIQVEFNPAKIGAYRLLGYENRALAAQDFNDDRKDAGDLGAGHTVTALYELVPVGVSIGAPGVDELKYQKTPSAPPASSDTTEAMTVKLRYKKPDANESERIELPLSDTGLQFENAPSDFKFATSAAAFAMLLRHSQYAGNATLDMVQQIAESAASGNADRSEFIALVVTAKTLSTRTLQESKASEPSSRGAAEASLNTVKLLDGGELNGIAMNAEQHEITVTIGTPIRGNLIVETFNAMHAGAVAPLCGTVDWGERSEQPWLAENWIKTGKSQYVVQVDKIAPNQPGTYHVIIAFRGEYNPAQVMSITNWEAFPDQRAVWSDGNDIGFDWTNKEYRQAMTRGVVQTRMLEANGRYTEVWQPAAVVTVHVRGN